MVLIESKIFKKIEIVYKYSHFKKLFVYSFFKVSPGSDLTSNSRLKLNNSIFFIHNRVDFDPQDCVRGVFFSSVFVINKLKSSYLRESIFFLSNPFTTYYGTECFNKSFLFEKVLFSKYKSLIVFYKKLNWTSLKWKKDELKELSLLNISNADVIYQINLINNLIFKIYLNFIALKRFFLLKMLLPGLKTLNFYVNKRQ